MRLRFDQCKMRKRCSRQKVRGPPPPWLIPELERQKRGRKPFEEQPRQREIPAGPLIIPIMPDDTVQDEKSPRRGVVIIQIE